jgi:hypothetical protein
MVRRQHRRQQPPVGVLYSPQFEWAFDPAGQPVPIWEAAHGGSYACPLCGNRMIARLGDFKQHHFAHEEYHGCAPDEVAQAAAARWIARSLRRCLDPRQSISIAWTCPICKETHTADLLAEIAQVQENYTQGDLRADVALLDASGNLRAAVAVQPPDRDALFAFARQSALVIVVDADGIRRRMHDLASLFRGSTIHGGVCTTQQAAVQIGIVGDIPVLRQALTQAAMTPPYHVYGALDRFQNLTHVFTLGNRRLWLPPILWQRAVGGLIHAINPALQIISQEWRQDDGSIIALYYVNVRESYAVAVRRFAPGQPVYARIDAAGFRAGRAAAVDIARSLAER